MERPRSWTELIEQLYADSWNPNFRRFRSPFAFRGHARLNHDLSNSLIRLSAGQIDLSKLELSLVRNFRKYAHAQTVAPVDSIWHWLALGQHHGLPTRLLDWTYSPFVALHFATEHPREFDADGVVWCVNFVEANRMLPAKLKTILQEEHSDTFTVEMLGGFPTFRAFDALGREPFVIFIEPPSLDARIIAQAAVFTLCTDTSCSFDAFLEAHGIATALTRFVIPESEAARFRDQLDLVGIDERRVFPDLDGVAEGLRRYYS